jgi:tetratricopeptide (TPR) repeat protein
MRKSYARARVLASVVALAGIASGVLSTRDASAQQSGAEVERAKLLFNAGAQFYAAGQFDSAIKAFEEANRLFPKPAIEFSIAQAHRRQYYLDKKPEHLQEAMAKYKRYIDATAEGGRKFEAAQALGELELIQAKTGNAADTASASGAGRAPVKEPPRIMVSSTTPNAVVTLDGAAPKPAPFGAEVTPGKHHVKISAPGYFDDERDVIADTILPLNADLREKPGRLTVNAPSNAQIAIDGRPVGETPLSGPIDVAPGNHYLSVSRNGRKAYARDFEIAREQKKTVDVQLEATGQRVVSYAILASGAALVLGGGVFFAAGLSKQSDAQSILDRRNAPGGSISQSELASYESLRAERNDWFMVSGIVGGVGGAALVTGAMFYFFDQPTAGAPERRLEDGPKKKPATPAPVEPMELTLTPSVSPTFAGGSMVGRF